MNESDFSDIFEKLTGNPPLAWQKRLFLEHFAVGKIPPQLDIPTGLGKTMVMAIWLIARAWHPEKTPRRLVYIVDRRTVVDQATDIASDFAYLLTQNNQEEDKRIAQQNPELAGRKRQYAQQFQELCQKLKLGDSGLAISALRGQLADNREWSRDPSRPAIIIGTVDLIGSALLFSGYRSSYKRRPVEAGLLGQDSLLVLDEAHLSKPFEKLVRSIERGGTFQKTQGMPMQVIRMSATSGDTAENSVFRLDADPASKTFDLWSERDENGNEKNPIKTRFEAKKQLTIVESEKLDDTIAAKADELAKEKPNSRIVIFVKTPKQVANFCKKLKEKNKDYANRIAQLTGTMRGLERDELVDTIKPLKDDDYERRAMQRFLRPDNDPSMGVCFLISTSAGEVGFDLNADHLVGDETTLDSWIQRLGRVNRRGNGDATVILVKKSKPADKTDFDKACIATSQLLKDEMDVSPKGLAEFKKKLTPEQIKETASPTPTTVELTDILLDDWSMTSITEPMPGRPPVGPWLHGIEDEQAQTTIAWRAELDLLSDDPSPEKTLQAVFTKHPIRPHESLTVNTKYLCDEFLKNIPKPKDRPDNLMATRVAIRMPRGQIVCRTLRQLTKEPGILYADSTLILPARFGGLDSAGLLDVGSIPQAKNSDDSEPPSLDIADQDGYEPTDAARSRLRILINRSEDGSWTPKALPGGVSIPEDINLKPAYDKSTALFNDLKAANLRVRLVQPLRFDEEGDRVESLVILAPAPTKNNKKEDQWLDDHVDAVQAAAKQIADSLHLTENDPFRIALLFAAKWHDEGKKACIWQIFANNLDPDGRPLGKMAQSRDPKSLYGYRHEFGSLLRIQHPDRCKTSNCKLPDAPEAGELALHLIAAHHGAGRPHFGQAVYEQFTDAERDAVHIACIRRFARLQRKYGWWRLAWLENLLRCADAMASADQDSDDDTADSEGDAT